MRKRSWFPFLQFTSSPLFERHSFLGCPHIPHNFLAPVWLPHVWGPNSKKEILCWHFFTYCLSTENVWIVLVNKSNILCFTSTYLFEYPILFKLYTQRTRSYPNALGTDFSIRLLVHIEQFQYNGQRDNIEIGHLLFILHADNPGRSQVQHQASQNIPQVF